jgi:2,4-diacetylphloroglucinol hydrolase
MSIAVNHSQHADAAAFEVGSAYERLLTPITYYPVALQEQFYQNEKSMAGKPYAKFFTHDLEVPVAWAEALQHGAMTREHVLTPSAEDMNKIIDPERRFPDAGYAVLDGPSAYSQSRIEMPGVTTDMFKWWFTWHPQEKERYMLWFPHAHIDNYCEDPKRLANPSLTYEQRLYNNPNHVDEYIGPSSTKIIIHFMEPTEFGIDGALLARGGFKASASGTIRLASDPDTTFMIVLHLARDTDRGLELYSRYWIGPNPRFGRFQGGANAPALFRRMGMSKETIRDLAYEMSVHDMTEFNQLARILPSLHKMFGHEPSNLRRKSSTIYSAQ